MKTTKLELALASKQQRSAEISSSITHTIFKNPHFISKIEGDMCLSMTSK